MEEVRLRAHLISKGGTLGTKRRVRVNLGGGLNKFHKKSTVYNANQRYEKREGINPDAKENSLFFETEKTIATKVRQPKKLAQKKGAKIAASLDKMYSDGAHAASAIETNEWERDNSVRVAQGLEPFTFKKWKNKKSTRENRRNSRGK